VFCHPDGRQYTRDDLNWRFAKVIRRTGLGRWHAYEGRHTAVSIMSTNGVPISSRKLRQAQASTRKRHSAPQPALVSISL